MKSHDHRQLGVRLGHCPVCKEWVWSNQPNNVVSVTPVALFTHVRCTRAYQSDIVTPATPDEGA